MKWEAKTLSLALVPCRDEDSRSQPWLDRRPSGHVWNLNVLLVDDDAADTSLILDVLRRHPDVAAVHAFDAPIAALRQLATGRQKPNLVLLDIHMPRLDGFEFLKELRRIESMVSVPVVFLTTSGLTRDVREYSASSASSYIIKPDTYFELQTRMDAVIKRALSGVWRR
ncbi:MAG: response regulator rcp1 [Phenylobacterium sp.]|nr:response regulator rcp1 [Phenylobacterium sp.]MDB5497931.1 response regulator rcp1 [Phenylobacterium sp.]